MAPTKRKGPGDMAGVAQISPEGISGIDDEMEVQLLGAGQEASHHQRILTVHPANRLYLPPDRSDGLAVS